MAIRKRAALVAALAALAAAPAGLSALADVSGWLSYGQSASRAGFVDADVPARAKLARLWRLRLAGLVTSQVLVADLPRIGRTLYVGTSRGTLFALTPAGSIRWRAQLGRLRHSCPQLDEWGLIGTPAIDPATRAIYAADPFGRLHALDLGTGVERRGWPVRIYRDYRREVVWGALAVAGGAVYVPTGSYCDRPMEGKVIRVDLASGSVSTWVSVPLEVGGGGGVWGWGGVAYSSARNSLLVVTGNAYEGGRNTGRVYRATAGYGEQLVELTPDLHVRSSSRPTHLDETGDFDFVGSPVPFGDPRCGELVAALNKNGNVYLWRARRIADGPVSTLRVERASVTRPIFTQLAYSPRTGALYVVTYDRLLRVDPDRRCRARVTWARRLGGDLANSSPTVAGDVVWLVRNGDPSLLLGVDARTGRVRFSARVGAPGLVAPTVLGNRVYFGLLDGSLHAFALR